MGGYGSGRRPVRPLAELAAVVTVADAQRLGLAGQLARVERPGRGVALYLRCPRCGGRAGILYAEADDRPLGCRRCVRPVYRSSRESDARLSRILGEGPAALARYAVPLGAPPGRPSMAKMLAGDLAAELARSEAGLLVLLRLADRLGLGVTRPPRTPSAAQGRPWSAARRAAHKRS